MLVASHNIMAGRGLAGLLPRYRRLTTDDLAILCLQENARLAGELPSTRIAAALGPSFAHQVSEDAFALAIVYDGARFDLLDHEIFALPRVERMSWLERRVILDGRPERMRAQLAVLRDRTTDRCMAVVNFHLDTVGGTPHRCRQMAAVVERVRAAGHEHALIACGDTNAFAPRRQRAALEAVLAPLAALGADDPGTEPTHFFARQREPGAVHRALVALGRLGIDLPHRYDVVCTNLPRTETGKLDTPESDHDLVWARVQLP